MKKFLSIPFFALVMTLILSASAFARNVTVVNSTGFDIHALSLSDTESDDAGANLLEGGILPPDYEITFDLQGGDSGWDLIAVDGDGGYVAFENLDFSGVSRVYLHDDGTISGE